MLRTAAAAKGATIFKSLEGEKEEDFMAGLSKEFCSGLRFTNVYARDIIASRKGYSYRNPMRLGIGIFLYCPNRTFVQTKKWDIGKNLCPIWPKAPGFSGW
jgi:hypothetical protein